MKKNCIDWLTIMLMAFVVCAGFTACGDDDDDDVKRSEQENVISTSNPLVGTWYASWTDTSKGHGTIIFRADGTGNDSGVNDEDSSNPYRWNDNFRYVILGYDTYLNTGKIYLIYSYGAVTWDFKLLSNTTLEFKGATFSKK